METTAVSVGKAVLHGALGYAKSKAAEEIALQLGIDGDVSFITDELEMMQSFLMTADEERDQQHKVLTTWVKQVRDLAYSVEDSLMDFSLQSELEKESSWCIPRNPCKRRRIAKEVKELRAKVEDVSSRNLRYRLIKGSGSMASATGVEQPGIAGAAMSATELEKSKLDLHQLITCEEVDLRVIAVWGTSGDRGKTSEIRKAYDDPTVKAMFGCRAWVRLVHPFNPKEFLGSLVRQFYENSAEETGKAQEGTTVGANVLLKMEKMGQSDFAHELSAKVSSNSYLIVINDLSTIEEWDCIKTYFPNKKNQSRIIVSTQQVEIATLCTEQPYQVSELKWLSSDQVLYLFHKKVMPSSDSTEHISDSNTTTTTKNNSAMSIGEIQEEDQQPKDAAADKVSNSSAGKRFGRSRTMALVDEVLTGRETDKSKVIKLIGKPEDDEVCKVISVWGMGGLGKTTLVRSVYSGQQLGGWKRAWATALRPFNPEVLFRSLALQLQDHNHHEGNIAKMGLKELIDMLTGLLGTQKYLIVLDDISSPKEWDSVKTCLENAKRIIVTTREKDVAKHCSSEENNMYNLEGLKEDAALNLFKRKQGDEGNLSNAFAAEMEKFPDLRYVHFDFHHICGGGNFDNLQALYNQMEETIQKQGYFLMNSKGEILLEQSGVVRSNCIDCLDRTNVTQSYFARKSLDSQLQRMGALPSDESISQSDGINDTFKKLWVEHGDELSLEYAGSYALKGDLVRYGKQTLPGLIKDGMSALSRYYLNNFHDGARQDALDLVSGYYTVSNSSPSPFQIGGFESALYLPVASAIIVGGITVTTFTLSQVGRNAQHFISSIICAGLTAGVVALVKANGKQFCSRPRLCGLI